MSRRFVEGSLTSYWGLCAFCGGFTFYLVADGEDGPETIATQRGLAIRCGVCIAPIKSSGERWSFHRSDIDELTSRWMFDGWPGSVEMGFLRHLLARAHPYVRSGFAGESHQFGFSASISSGRERFNGLVTGALCLTVLSSALEKLRQGEPCATVTVVHPASTDVRPPRGLYSDLSEKLDVLGFRELSAQEKARLEELIIEQAYAYSEREMVDQMVRCVPRVAQVVKLVRDPALGNMIGLVGLVLALSSERRRRSKDE